MAKVRQTVMNHQGDEQFEIDTADPVALEEANKRFKELTGLGFLPYAPGDNGEPGKVLKDFDATVEETIFRPRLVGG